MYLYASIGMLFLYIYAPIDVYICVYRCVLAFIWVWSYIRLSVGLIILANDIIKHGLFVGQQHIGDSNTPR